MLHDWFTAQIQDVIRYHLKHKLLQWWKKPMMNCESPLFRLCHACVIYWENIKHYYLQVRIGTRFKFTAVFHAGEEFHPVWNTEIITRTPPSFNALLIKHILGCCGQELIYHADEQKCMYICHNVHVGMYGSSCFRSWYYTFLHEYRTASNEIWTALSAS